MAGDYIPMQTDLDKRREVLLICRATGWSKWETIGRLWHFWSWVSQETSDGVLPGVDVEVLGSFLGVPSKFVSALIDVGWLEATTDALIVPHFDRWFSASAKARLGERERKSIARRATARPPHAASGQRSGHSSGQLSGQTSGKFPENFRTTKQENTGEDNSPPISPPAAANQLRPAGRSSPGGDGSRAGPDDRSFDEWWSRYPRKVGKQAARRAYVRARQRIRKEADCTPAEARRVLLEAVTRFASSGLAKTEFCPHPTTWLNQGRWEDDPAEWERSGEASAGTNGKDRDSDLSLEEWARMPP